MACLWNRKVGFTWRRGQHEIQYRVSGLFGSGYKVVLFISFFLEVSLYVHLQWCLQINVRPMYKRSNYSHITTVLYLSLYWGFLDLGRSQSATTVVGVIVITFFKKCLRIVMRLRIHIRVIIPDRSTILDFHRNLLFLFISSVIHNTFVLFIVYHQTQQQAIWCYGWKAARSCSARAGERVRPIGPLFIEGDPVT